MGTNKINNNTSYTPGLENKHNQKFLEKYTQESFLEKMTKTRSDIHPDFLAQFDKYTSEVSSLLSENISVVASRVVASTINEENYRVINALSKTGKNAEKLSKILTKEVYNQTRNHKKPINNLDYKPMNLEAV